VRLVDHRVKYPAYECDIGDGSPAGFVDHFDEPVKGVSPRKLTETGVEFFDLRLEVGDVLLVQKVLLVVQGPSERAAI
jgi:hypothetical protein